MSKHGSSPKTNDFGTTPIIAPQVRDHLKKYNYDVVEYLCNGSTCSVYKIIDQGRKRFAAAKVMEIAKLPALVREQLLPNELSIVRQIQHTNIIRTEQVFSLTAYAVIVTEFATDGDLITYIEGASQPDLISAKRWFVQVTQALKYLHGKGIAHRDIKAENVLLFGQIAKLADFGYAICCLDNKGEIMLCTSCCGTLEYKAPEILICTTPYNALISDCFSLGVLLYVLVTHQFPFGSGDDIRTTSGLKALYNGITHKAWQPNDIIARQYRLHCLLCQLLNPDIKERISAAQALEHQWIVEYKDVK